MKLDEYQLKAVEKIVKGFKELSVSGNPSTTIVLKSPTGSGKTVMMASALDQIRNEDLPCEYVYIWASMGDLSHQSYKKLHDEYLVDSEFTMLELEQIQAQPLSVNTILFCNWEKMYQIKREDDGAGNQVEIFKNVYVRIGESGRNLQKILEGTRNEGKRIVLIVDEAHHTYLGTNSQKLVERVIKPNITIEVSATPTISLPAGYYESNLGRWIEVPLQDVIDSGLIKNNTIINNNINGVVDKNSADTAVLAAALKQRETLAQKYKKAGTNINPLVLIQLPSEGEKTSEADETMLEMIERYMDEQGITYENGKLAVWMSGNYHPSDVKVATVPNDSEIEVLIFKQAIATGWDCPRASILVMLRDIQSVVFEIQTVGRIMRMPELKHYKDEALNTAYVFTNINEMALAEDDDAKAFFKLFKSERVADFTDDFVWPNVYRKRIVGQRYRLNQNFRKIILPLLDKEFKIDVMDTLAVRRQKVDDLFEIDASELKISILSDVAFKHLDDIDQTIFQDEAHHTQIKADEAYIERTFNYFLKGAVSPFAPHDSSRILKSVLYKWFSENDFDDESEVQRIIACSAENQNVLLEIIEKAKTEFAKTLDKETELTANGFSIPLEQEFGDKYEKHSAPRHALQPYFRSQTIWQTEKTFEEAVDASDTVEWWFRNGNGEPKYFAVKYEYEISSDETDESLFYPDYIVKFKDGTFGIFDTKSGDTLDPSTEKGKHVDKKADALQNFFRNYDEIAKEYVEQKIEITEQKGLWGGIINVKNGSFYLQKDGITHSMAKKLLNGESVDLPSVGYNKDEWISWVL